jgi:branched-chain amino acid transport system substrate-binding protein
VLAASTAFAAEPIKIGALFSVTGTLASTDAPALNGVKLAAKEINDAGGALGRPIELAVYDGKSDSPVVSTAGSQVINSDRVVAIVAFTDSDAVLALGPQVEKAGIPLLTPGATSPKLPSQVGKYAFLACFGDNVQAPAGAEFALNKLKFKTAYLWTDN